MSSLLRGVWLGAFAFFILEVSVCSVAQLKLAEVEPRML